jgi:two-component system cell cycle response regulator
MDQRRGDQGEARSEDVRPNRALPTMKLRTPPNVAARGDPDRQNGAPVTERPPLTPVTIVLPATPPAPDRATLMVLGGVRAGASYTLGDDVVIGRGGDIAIEVDDVSVSRRHARIVRAPDGSHWIEDLGSTNGTFVSGRRVERALLASGDRVQLGRESLFRFAVVDAAEEELQRELYESSLRDTLTALANRRCLFERLGDEIWHARREQRALSLLVVDVDHFKSINDRFGHLAGDQVLRAIAQAGGATLRGGDLFARYGGEEFAVVARDAELKEARVLAERLRATLGAMHVEVGNGAVRVTVSVGVASLAECLAGDEATALFARADARLYAAKCAGRDRVVSADPPAAERDGGGEGARAIPLPLP